MIKEIQKDAEGRMSKSVESLSSELSKVRTGRANVGILDHVMVNYYGNPTALNQVASVTASDARTLVITPWEKTMVEPIEKAIMESNLGLNPSSAGTVIRVPMPPLTEERRKELTKLVRAEGEQGRIAIRNIRRDANNQFKELVKEKQISEDEERKAIEVVQKITDKYIHQIDELIVAKEKDLMVI